MRSGRSLLVGLTVLALGTALVVAQQDAAPWHIIKHAKLSTARDGAGAAADAGPQKYLHVEVRFNVPPSAEKKQNFRVVNAQGDEVGELWGWNDGRSLVIFEGNWGSLVGLYLDGNGHREPLFEQVVARADPVVTTPRRGVQRPAYVPPTRVYTPPVTDRVVVRDREPVYVPRDRVIVRDDGVTDRVVVRDRDRVIVHDDVLDRVIGPDVIVEDRGADRVVIHDGPDRVVVHDGGDRVVVHDHGDRVVVHDGGVTHVGGGGSTVVVDRDSGKVIDAGGGTQVASAGDGSGPGSGSGSGSGSGDGSGPGSGPGDGSSGSDPAAGSGDAAAASPDSGKPDSGSGDCPCGKDGSKPDSSKPDSGKPDNSLADASKPDSGQPDSSKPDSGPADSGKPDAAQPDSGQPDSGPADGSKPSPASGPGTKPDAGSGDCPCGDKPGAKPGPDGPGSGPGAKPGTGSGDCPCGDGPGSKPGPDGSGTGPGPGPGSGPGPGPGGPGPKPGPYGPGPQPGPTGTGPLASTMPLRDMRKPDKAPDWVLYVTTGTETSPGTVYQVDENGRVLGKTKLPYTATGMALEGTHGVVLAVPRDGGKIMKIDDTGKLSTILEKDPALPHPVDVGIAGDSSTVVVADNIADVLAATTTAGTKPKVYQRFEGQKWTAQGMSVAVTNDKHVIFSNDAEPGVYRYAGDQPSAGTKPILPNYGGVAADPKSLRWAAAQEPNLVYVYEGEQQIKKLRLPPGKSVYKGGLLSFSPAGTLCVACRDSDKQGGEPWLMMYDLDKDEVRSLFPWKYEQMQDFVVGPRMPWNRNEPKGYKSTF